ncbi:MAG: hypothetical protein F6J93_25775 [Oscillatoria sp. SIO1A7]|nr:hypothetical protein [Oscillatoria sp. SIO1A7]
MQVNNVPVQGLRLRSARTVTVKERLETGTLFLRKSLTLVAWVGQLLRMGSDRDLEQILP